MSYTYYFGTPASCLISSKQALNNLLAEHDAPFVFAFDDMLSKAEVTELIKRFSKVENSGLLYGVTLTDPDDDIFYTERSIFITTTFRLRDIFEAYPKLTKFTLVEFKRDREYTASMLIKTVER